jgi:MerR family transcriptional regulator, light-induced transcriptional regulator
VTRPAKQLSAGLLSIGALSAATGIPVETIRTWERRYGFPRPERKPSGHRVYPVAAVPRLRRVAQAIARGHRAAEVLRASEAALEQLLSVPMPEAAPPPLDPPRTPIEPGDLLGAVTAFDAEHLKRAFHDDWARLGPLRFLEERAAPFLASLGAAWAEGRLDVRHEHFGSASLGDFLRVVRLPLDERATGPLVALATLPGEAHTLGLQMAAVVLALAGWRVLMLGAETPPEQIVALVREAPLAAVALSLVKTDGQAVARAIAALRRRLPQPVALLLGGAGVEAQSMPGTWAFRTLTELDRWARSSAGA